MLLLDVGCGKNCKAGHVGLDKICTPSTDLNVDRFPFEDNSVDGIYSYHALEHLTIQGFHHCLGEMYRVSKPNSKWAIHAPYFNSTGTQANPYHTNNIFNEFTFYFFSKTLGPKYAEFPVRKGTANEGVDVTLVVENMAFLYFKEYKHLLNLSPEEQFKIRMSHMNVVINIEYYLRVEK